VRSSALSATGNTGLTTDKAPAGNCRGFPCLDRFHERRRAMRQYLRNKRLFCEVTRRAASPLTAVPRLDRGTQYAAASRFRSLPPLEYRVARLSQAMTVLAVEGRTLRAGRVAYEETVSGDRHSTLRYRRSTPRPSFQIRLTTLH
jgi:hypothetical protein